MRMILPMLLSYAAAQTSAAPAVDCRSLAEAYHSEPRLMTATTLAQTRTCIDARTWAPSPAASTPPAGERSALFRLKQASACEPLSDRFARYGGGPLSEAERSTLRKCVDDAITVISSQPRPGYQANMPKNTPRKELEGRV